MKKVRQIKVQIKPRLLPEKVVAPELNPKGNDIAIESVEITHEGLVVENDDDKKP